MRSTSGVFAQLTSAQINGKKKTNFFNIFFLIVFLELKESFTLLDKNGNGVIEKEDLQAMLISLGIIFYLWILYF